MKKNLILLCLLGGLLLTTGCGNNTYSSLRNAEDKLIANFISRNNINVLKQEPADDYVWAENDYLQVPGYDDLYFHLRYRGDSIEINGTDTTYLDPIQSQETVVIRYKQFELTENADTLSFWTTLDQAYPAEFQYNNLTSCECVGWHVAVKYMKYTNAECQIICPSKQGFVAAQTSVTPYCYIMRMRIKR